tara:strand:- start:18188 stop:18418 length:231 start_codon:yes stop_codon:yes gene_type:complete
VKNANELSRAQRLILSAVKIETESFGDYAPSDCVWDCVQDSMNKNEFAGNLGALIAAGAITLEHTTDDGVNWYAAV